MNLNTLRALPELCKIPESRNYVFKISFHFLSTNMQSESQRKWPSVERPEVTVKERELS